LSHQLCQAGLMGQTLFEGWSIIP